MNLIHGFYRNAIIAALILEIQSIACCWICDWFRLWDRFIQFVRL